MSGYNREGVTTTGPGKKIREGDFWGSYWNLDIIGGFLGLDGPIPGNSWLHNCVLGRPNTPKPVIGESAAKRGKY